MVKILNGRTENSVKNRFNCLYKKVKDEQSSLIKGQNLSQAQQQQQQVQQLNEDEILELLIKRKQEEIEENINNPVEEKKSRNNSKNKDQFKSQGLKGKVQNEAS